MLQEILISEVEISLVDFQYISLPCVPEKGKTWGNKNVTHQEKNDGVEQ